MKNFRLLFTFLALSPLFIFGQHYRFVYEYKYIPYKNRMDSSNIDYMNLDTDGKKSLFFNDAKHKMDSAFSISKNLNELIKYKNYNQSLNYTISKDYGTSKMNYYSKKFNLEFIINEKELPKWNLINQFSVINNYKCQKAYTQYKGREWTAWFTNDIPISDGPYKFSGLPGLIIKISDKEENHKFELIQIMNIKNPYLEVPKKSREITQIEFNKLMNKNFNIKTDVSFTNVTANTVTVGLTDGNIMNMNKNENSDLDEKLIKKLRLSDNPIEIY